LLFFIVSVIFCWLVLRSFWYFGFILFAVLYYYFVCYLFGDVIVMPLIFVSGTEALVIYFLSLRVVRLCNAPLFCVVGSILQHVIVDVIPFPALF
jgi:hypothetical protein